MTYDSHTENIFKVMYAIGLLDGQKKYIYDLDLDETIEIAQLIAKDWENFVDILNYEEEGYISVYTQRVFPKFIMPTKQYMVDHYGYDKEVVEEMSDDYIKAFLRVVNAQKVNQPVTEMRNFFEMIELVSVNNVEKVYNYISSDGCHYYYS